MKILVDENIDLLYEVLSEKFEVIKIYGRELTNQFIVDSDAEFLFIRSTCQVNESLLKNTKVKFVASATAGIDHIDLKYLLINNIYFTNAIGGNANSVAEYVVYSILHWAINQNINLRNKSIGIVGYGNIGSLIGKYAKDLGLQININDEPLKNLDVTKFPSYVTHLNLNEIITNCDIISNHVPLEFHTLHPTLNLFNHNNMLNFKNELYLIHTSRGGVINESDLNNIYKSKHFNLAIDVWEDEPNFHDEIVENALIATPHIAGYSYDGKVKGAKIIAEKFASFINQKIDFSIFDAILNEKKAKIQDFESIQSLYNEIEKHRKFNLDIDEFRKCIGLSKEDKMKRFNLFRKNYPIRREVLS